METASQNNRKEDKTMGNPCVCKPGEIVQLAGIDFMVLEDLTPFNGDGDEHDLFVLAVDSQGTSRFGDTNNYAESDLRKATEKWLTEKLYDHGCNPDYIKSRKLDLTTLEGYKGYGELDVWGVWAPAVARGLPADHTHYSLLLSG